MTTEVRGHAEPPAREYRVTRRDGCVLIYGSVPINDFVALSKTMPPKSVMHTGLARLAGCNLAMGSAEDTRTLFERIADERIASMSNPSPLDVWLIKGERGKSSEAIVSKLRGPLPGLRAGITDHPLDPDDLRRCLLLLRAVPELDQEMYRMADVSPQWQALVACWDSLTASLDAELKGGKARKAPQTWALMRQLLESI